MPLLFGEAGALAGRSCLLLDRVGRLAFPILVPLSGFARFTSRHALCTITPILLTDVRSASQLGDMAL